MIETIIEFLGGSWKSGSEDDSSREKTPFLQDQNGTPKEIPKYLELVYDAEDYPSVDKDGYEIPTSEMKKIKNVEERSTNLEDFSPTPSVVDSVEIKEPPIGDFNKVVHDLTAIENLLKNKIARMEQESERIDAE